MITNNSLLKFGKAKDNAKLQQIAGKTIVFDLPASYACPGALLCASKSVMGKDGKVKIVDGKENKFRCFAASLEIIYPSVRRLRWHNFDLLKECKGDTQKMYDLILNSLPKDFDTVRIHSSGDFFTKNYLQAWIKIANNFPNKLFYAYTKSLNFWVELIDEIPSNLKLNASKGGKLDHLIDEYNLKFVEVVYNEKSAEDKNLEIDHSDKLAFAQDKSFAILIHGMQKGGSEEMKAVLELRKQGKGSYNREAIKAKMELKVAA